MFYMMVSLYYSNLSEKFSEYNGCPKSATQSNREFLHVDPLWPIVKWVNYCHAGQYSPSAPSGKCITH